MLLSMKPVRILPAICLAALLLAAADTGAVQTRPFTGMVIEADREARILTVRAADAAEPFQVKVSPGDAAIGYTGETVRGQIVQYGQMSRLQRIWPDDPVDNEVARGINQRLHRDTLERGYRAIRQRGDYLPKFALYDQHGRLVTTDDLHGDYLVLNFIFTRCTVPTFCPAATSRMLRLQREAAEEGVRNLRLVTITFDPEYDTPGILRYYADSRGVNGDWHTFLTGDPQAIQDLMKQFGILIKEEQNTLTHTMNTLLVEPKGKIIFNRNGPRWSTAEFLERIIEHQRLRAQS